MSPLMSELVFTVLVFGVPIGAFFGIWAGHRYHQRKLERNPARVTG